MPGASRAVDARGLLTDCLVSSARAAVIILVVADDQPLGHALDLGRVARQRLELVGHERSSGQTEALTSIEIARSAVARSLMRSLQPDKGRPLQHSRLPRLGSFRP